MNFVDPSMTMLLLLVFRIECNTSPRSGGHRGPQKKLEGFQVVGDAIWAIFGTQRLCCSFEKIGCLNRKFDV